MILRYSLNPLALFLLLIYNQAEFFVRYSGAASIVIGFSIFCFCLLTGRLKFKFGFEQYCFLLLLGFMSLASLVLLVFGEENEFSGRNIFLSSLVQITFAVLIFGMMKSYEGIKSIVFVVILILIIESIIIAGQFTYITYGFGIETKPRPDFTEVMIPGSQGNPNNAAVFVGLLTLMLTAFFSMRKQYLKAYFFLFYALLIIWLTLSRAMLVVWALNFIAVFWISNFRGGYKGDFFNSRVTGLLILLLSVGTILFLYPYMGGDVVARSTEKTLSILSASEDSSINFRYITHLRLLEGFFDLGFGTFSDMNYGRFYKGNDFSLMAINPHSYITEFSFLFGYPGFFIITTTFAFLMLMILVNKNLSFSFRLLSCLALMLSQAVPSSLLVTPYFFVPFIFMWLLWQPRKEN